jgi:UDP-glucose 4-epimerase
MSFAGKSVMVTGGAGFIGSHLVDRLIADEPRRIVVVDNFFLGKDRNLEQARAARPDLVVQRMDASSLPALRDIALANEVEHVFDLAVIPLTTSISYPDWTFQMNAALTAAVCELARSGVVDEILHMSSSEVYGSARQVPMSEEHPHDVLTPYAASKSAGDKLVESYVRTFGIKARTARPFNNVGPRQNDGAYAGVVPSVVTRIANGEPITITGDGSQTRDFIYAPRTADILVRAASTDMTLGQTFNVGSGRELSINDLVRRILSLMGADDHPIAYVPERAADVHRHLSDITLAGKLFGLVPQQLSDDELMCTIEYYQALRA